MTRFHETELKLGLPDEAAWARLRERIAPVRLIRQVNHFFDGAGRPLRAARIGLRLRATPTRLRLTLKADAGADGEAVTRRIELEEDWPAEALRPAIAHGLDPRDALARWRVHAGDDPSIAALLDRVDDVSAAGPLRTFGAFENERTVGSLALSDPAGSFAIPVELDRTTFPGGRVDFELEVEADPASSAPPDLARVHRALGDWLEREVGTRGEARPSKLARFEAALEADERASR